MGELTKAAICAAFGVTETELDEFDPSYTAARAAADAEYAHFRDVVIPARVRQIEAELSQSTSTSRLS